MSLLEKAIDKLLITFIFLNVFAFDFNFGGIPLRYIILCILFFLTFIVSPQEILSKHIISFYFVLLLLYSVLIFYSLICGNDIQNIISIVRPLSIFILIPTVSFMFRKNGHKRYINAFVVSVIILVFLFVYLFILSFVEPSKALDFSSKQDLIMILLYDFIPRVFIKTFVFIIPVALYFFLKYDGLKLFVSFIAVLSLSFLSQTFGIVFVVLILYTLVLYKKKKYGIVLFNIMFGLAVYCFMFLPISGSFLDVKEGSFSYKEQQISNIAKDMDGVKILTGRGIGAVFDELDGRKLKKERTIEVFTVQVFQYGGLLFSWLILYPYFFPILPFLGSGVNDPRFFLSYSQLGIIIASLSNPYLWGGGMGFFFIVITVAYKASNHRLINYV